MTTLTPRQGAILTIIVDEYIDRAVPVASHNIARRQDLRVSPATIRNEMAELEEAGYIRRPHVSAGSVPSDKGYRYFVATTAQEATLPQEEARRVQNEFRQAVEDIELWTDLAADLLASLVNNMALVSPPKAGRSRMKRLDLVLLQQTLALLVLVLQHAKTRKRIMHLEGTTSQDELNGISNKLSALFGGATSQAMSAPEAELSPLERQVLDAAREMMADEDLALLEEPVVHGLRHFFAQPEFVGSARASALVDLLEDRKFLKDFIPRLASGEQVRVAIGDEIPVGELRECSVVVSRYGTEDRASGIVAVIGPMRMPYQRSIASVRLLSRTMTDLVSSLS